MGSLDFVFKNARTSAQFSCTGTCAICGSQVIVVKVQNGKKVKSFHVPPLFDVIVTARFNFQRCMKLLLLVYLPPCLSHVGHHRFISNNFQRSDNYKVKVHCSLIFFFARHKRFVNFSLNSFRQNHVISSALRFPIQRSVAFASPYARTIG